MTENLVKWLFVCGCFLAAAVCPKPAGKRDKRLLCLALGCTAAADFLILITPCKGAGVFVFCFAHAFHIFRCSAGGWRRFALPAAAVFSALNVAARFPLYINCAVYAALACAGVCAALARARRERSASSRIAAAGMVMFACCDAAVALYNTVLKHDAALAAIWLFYAPSQAFLALSAYDI
jgi:hypothetical protein